MALPSWLTSGNGGTGAPIPVSAWLDPNYPGGYAGWLNDHPNPGNSPTPPSNPVYKAWLQQHVSNGQLNLPPASSVAPPPAPAAPPPPAPVAPAPAPSGGTTAPVPKTPLGGGHFGTGNHGHKNKNDGGTTAPVPKTPLGGGNFGTGDGAGSDNNIPRTPLGGGNAGTGGQGATVNSSISTPPSPSQTGGISIPHGKSTGGIQPAASNNGPGGYTVVKGDTMWDIANAHGISLQQLEAMNPQIKNPDLIFPGQQINLKGGATGPVESPPAGTGGQPVPLPGGGGGNTGGSGGTTTGPIESPPHGVTGPPVHLPHPGGGGGTTDGGTNNGPIESPPLGSNHPPAHLPGSSGNTSDGNKLVDPAIHGPHNQITTGGGAGQDLNKFPTSSTYPPTDSNTSQSALSKLKARVRGWGSASGNAVPSDPANRAIIVGSNEDTNPLHIKDQNQNNGHQT